MKRTPADSLLKVLIIGRHQDTLNRILKTSSLLPIRIDGAITDDQAFDFLHRNRYDVISVGGGIETATPIRLRDALMSTMPDIQVIEVPRPDSESIDVLARKPIQIDGPDELAEILSGILARRQSK